MKQIGLFLVLAFAFGSSAQAQNGEFLEALDGATYVQVGRFNSSSDMELINLNRNGVGRFLTHTVAEGREFVCEQTLISSGRFVSGKSDKCHFADNGQTNPTECNLFLTRESDGKLKGTAYCNYYSYNIEMILGSRRDRLR